MVELVAESHKVSGTELSGLVLNERGWERFHTTGLARVNVTVAATDAFSERNAGMPREEALRQTTAILQEAGTTRSTATISVAFGDPFDGAVDEGAVVEVAERLAAAGAGELVLADTIGVATPRAVRRLTGARRRARTADGRSLPQHAQHRLRQRARRARRRRHRPRRLGRGSRRLSLRPARNREHRHRGPRLPARGRGRRDRHRPPCARRCLALDRRTAQTRLARTARPRWNTCAALRVSQRRPRRTRGGPMYDAAAPDPRRWKALFLLCAAFFMVVLDVAIVNVALPSIATDLKFTQDNLQWVITAYSLTFGGFLLLGGRAADLLGRRIVFMVGVTIFTLASLSCGLAQSEAWLIIARAVQGFGAALLTPAALSIITTTFTERAERNKALGVWGAVGGGGAAAGVLMGGILTKSWAGSGSSSSTCRWAPPRCCSPGGSSTRAAWSRGAVVRRAGRGAGDERAGAVRLRDLAGAGRRLGHRPDDRPDHRVARPARRVHRVGGAREGAADAARVPPRPPRPRRRTGPASCSRPACTRTSSCSRCTCSRCCTTPRCRLGSRSSPPRGRPWLWRALAGARDADRREARARDRPGPALLASLWYTRCRSTASTRRPAPSVHRLRRGIALSFVP